MITITPRPTETLAGFAKRMEDIQKSAGSQSVYGDYDGRKIFIHPGMNADDAIAIWEVTGCAPESDL